MQFLRVSRKKNGDFPCGAKFISRVVHDCLSKCPNSKKTPQPKKIPSYAPDSQAYEFFSSCKFKER